PWPRTWGGLMGNRRTCGAAYTKRHRNWGIASGESIVQWHRSPRRAICTSRRLSGQIPGWFLAGIIPLFLPVRHGRAKWNHHHSHRLNVYPFQANCVGLQRVYGARPHRMEPILAVGGVLGALRQGGVQVSGWADALMCGKLGLAPAALPKVNRMRMPTFSHREESHLPICGAISQGNAARSLLRGD